MRTVYFLAFYRMGPSVHIGPFADAEQARGFADHFNLGGVIYPMLLPEQFDVEAPLPMEVWN